MVSSKSIPSTIADIFRHSYIVNSSILIFKILRGQTHSIFEKNTTTTPPTLIIVGEKDKATPVEMSQHLNKEIIDSKLNIIPDSKHMVMVENPKEFNEIVAEFIR